MGLEGPVEIAGLRLCFEMDGEVVKVTDADTETRRYVGNAFSFNRADGPLLDPAYAYHEQLGKSTGDRHGSAKRDQIAKHAKEFRAERARKGNANTEPGAST